MHTIAARSRVTALLMTCVFLGSGCEREKDVQDGAAVSGVASQQASGRVFDQVDVVDVRPLRYRSLFVRDQIWTLTRSGKVFHSADRGETWRLYALPIETPIEYMGIAKDGDVAVLVADGGVLLRSDDGGSAWVQVSIVEQVGVSLDPLWGADFSEVRFDDTLRTGIWVASCDIMRTDDGGLTWTNHTNGFEEHVQEGLCANDALLDDDGRLTLAALTIHDRPGMYVFRSDDDGKTWKWVCRMDEGAYYPESQDCRHQGEEVEGWRGLGSELSQEQRHAHKQFDDSATQRILAEERYSVSPKLLEPPGVDYLKRDRSSDRVWYDDERILAYTDDLGEHWKLVTAGLPDESKFDFSLGLGDGWAVGTDNAIYRTGDGGRRWQRQESSISLVSDLWIDIESARVLVANDQGVHRFEQESAAWTNVAGVDVAQYRLVAAGDSVWSFGEELDVFHSADRGLTWRRVANDVDEGAYYIDAAYCSESECLWAENSGKLMHTSVSRPTTDVVDLNKLVSGLFSDDYAFAMQFSPNLATGWLVTEKGQIYLTDDGGRSWSREEKYRGDYNEVAESPGGAAALIYGYGDNYIATSDGRNFHTSRLPGVGSEGSITSVCWLDDRLALISASTEYNSIDLETSDGGQTWRASNLRIGHTPCSVGAGLVQLERGLVRVKSAN